MTKPMHDPFEILNHPEKMREIMQLGIYKALLQHKRANNPICESRDGNIRWVQPKDIKIPFDLE